MSEHKNSFILYTNYYDILKDLSNEDAGILFKAILKYQATKEIDDLPSNLKIAFSFIKNQFDIDEQKYNSYIEKQKANGLKGGRPKTQKSQQNPKNPSLFLKTQKSLNDNDNENDNVNDNENDNKKITPLPFGNFQNVYLTEKQKKEFECLVMDKKTAEEIINNLSENIACKKEQIFDEQYPDMHLLRLKKYWQFYKSKPKDRGGTKSFSEIQQLLDENYKKLTAKMEMNNE